MNRLGNRSVGFLYLKAQRVDNARIAENHQNQRQEISDKKYEQCHRFLRSHAVVHSPRHADPVDDIRSEYCHQCLKRWNENPDGGNHGNQHKFLDFLLHETTSCLLLLLFF